jgi:trans-aconitate 2-methyltransferase
MENKNYNWNPSDYADNSSAQFIWGKELLDLLDLKGNEAVLDIGCGDGKITELISQKLQNGRVIGIDSSKDMIRFAKQKHINDSVTNLSFELADACSLNYENEFDIVYSNATLHWIKDQTCVLQNVRKCLKKDGKILFQMGGKGNIADLLKIVDIVLKSDKWKSYFEGLDFPYFFFNDTEYSDFLKKENFIIDKVELIPRIMTQNSPEDFAGWIRTTWHPYLERIPFNLLDNLIYEIVNKYISIYPPDSEGKTNLKMVRLQVRAHK